MEIGLGLSLTRKGSGSASLVLPLTGLVLSYAEVQEADAVGTLIGHLVPTGGVAPYSYALTSNPGGLVQLDGTVENQLEVGADLTGQTTFAISVEVTDSSPVPQTFEEDFTITVVADTSNGSGDDGSGTVVDDGGFDVVPIPGNTGDGTKLPGKNGGAAMFVYDIGPIVAGTTYIYRYSADWSQMTLQGREAMIGFGFKAGDNFHGIGLRGDGGNPTTTMLNNQTYGSFAGKAKNMTRANAGAATNGTKAGPNWIRLIVSADGSTIDFATSADGVAWDDEYTAVTTPPLGSPGAATTFGLFAFFTQADRGAFVITIENYAAQTVPAQFGTGDWSVADKTTGGTVTISINALPDDGGSAITDLEYQIDGGSWVSLAGTATGDYDVSGLTDDVEIDVAIRAVNAFGNGTASATKAVTPTLAPPQLIGFDINRSFTYTNLTISKPSGTVSGSLLVAHIGVGNPSVKAIPPAGWVHVRTGVFGNARSSVFYKIAGGSEPASYTFQIDDVGRKAGAIIRVEGYDAANIVHKEGLTGANSNSNPANTPSVTTTINNCLILRFANAGWNGFTFTPPSGVTEIYDTANAAGGAVGSSITGGWENLATAGASGVKGFTISSSAHYSGITMAVAPSGGSAPTVESFASALDETVSFSQAVKDLGLPAGAAEGDVLIAAVAGGNNTTSITPPAGWTQIAATEKNFAFLAVFRKVVAASETTPYVFSSNDGTAAICAGIAAFRGIDTTTPVIDHAEDGSTSNSTTVAMTGLALSGSQAIQLQIAAAGWGQSNQIHPGVGMTHVFSFSPCVNNASNPGLYLEYALREAPATYGESLLSAQSFNWSTMNLLLNPA